MAEKFPKEKELYSIFSQCLHRNPNQVANDAANILYNYQKQFAPMLNPSYDGGNMKYLLELKGELSIQYKGTNYSIITSIGFPFIYPDAPAVIKIYNPDINKFSVNQHFIQGASPDQSVVNINIPELANWYSHKQIMRVMMSLVKELGSHFPFFDKSIQRQNQYQTSNVQQGGYQQQPYYGNQYQQQPQQFGYNNQQQQQQYYPNYQGQNNAYNPQQYNPYQQQQQGYQNYNQSYSGNNSPQIQQNQNNQQSQINLEQQLKSKCINALQLQEMQKYFSELKQSSDKLVKLISEQEQRKSQLQQLEITIDQSLNLVQNENKKLQDFINNNDKFELNEQTVLQLVQEEDSFSQQVLDCISDISAYKETFHFILEKFRRTNLGYDTFIKATRKLAEEQFNQVLLLKKCQGKLQKK